MNGYHVEFFSRETSGLQNDNLQKSIEAEISDQSLVDSLDIANLNATPSEINTQPEALAEKAVTPKIKRKQPRKVLALSNEKEQNANTTKPEKINAEVHPSAAGSLLMGILSALSFIMLFVIQFNPVWLVIALIIALIVFALLAQKMAKQAFDDMYYARNKYSGKGLAAAGLALGVISIVALIGLALVILFGVAFISFS